MDPTVERTLTISRALATRDGGRHASELAELLEAIDRVLRHGDVEARVRAERSLFLILARPLSRIEPTAQCDACGAAFPDHLLRPVGHRRACHACARTPSPEMVQWFLDSLRTMPTAERAEALRGEAGAALVQALHLRLAEVEQGGTHG